MTARRHSTAGVSLIEMLVVLALFAVVAGAVALSLPGGRPSTSALASAQALVAHLNRALDVALTTSTGFGVKHDGGALRFVQRNALGEWTSHTDQYLAQAKLSVERTRTSINAQEVYAVSDQLIPTRSAPFRVTFETIAVVFDGARVHLVEGS